MGNPRFSFVLKSSLAINSCELEQQLIIPVTLIFDNYRLSTVAMIDSGATGCFINQNLVTRYQIPVKTKKIPRTLEVVDGREISSGIITESSDNVILEIEKHKERIQFDVTRLGHYPIILGTPWLKNHDPVIHWSRNTIQFDSKHCLKHCHSTFAKVKGLSNYHHEDPTIENLEVKRKPQSLSEIIQSVSVPVPVSVSAPVPGLVSAPVPDLVSAPVLDLVSVPASVSVPVSVPVPDLVSVPIPAPDSISNLDSNLDSDSDLISDNFDNSTQLICSLDAETLISEPSEKKSLEEAIPKEYHDFLDVFSKESADKLPPHRPYDHKIPLHPNTQPPFGPIYSLSEPELKALKDYIKENLEKGFIRSSSSPAGAPILFVKKKDGSLRLCVDYRGLNNVTIKNRYPLPLINELIDRLHKAKYFTKIDLRGAYNLVRIASGEEWKTAFRTRYGHYEYLVMPFGLSNAPASFQHLINDVLSDYLDTFVVAYLDDILIFSDSLDEHVNHVKKVLQRLRENHLYAKEEKCEFHKKQTEFLGFLISSNGISMDHTKTSSIDSWPAPKNIKDIQSFLGFANFYRRFIKGFSQIVGPITRLLRKNQPWDWNQDAQTAFENLKKAFTSAPILRYYNPEFKCVLETDASDYAIGAILSQINEDHELHPVAYYSRKLSPAELNYEIYDKEMLAIVEAFKEWRHYLEGAQHKITVYSDHKNLEYFTKTKTLNRRQARWSEYLGSFDFVIEYRSGLKNGKPDALSRRADYRPEEGNGATTSPKPVFLKPDQLRISAMAQIMIDQTLLDSIRKALDKDPAIADIRQLISENDLAASKFKFENQLLLMNNLIYVPDDPEIKLKILKEHHDSCLAGHPGQSKTYELVSRNYTWPRIRKYVKDYVDSCHLCKRCKHSRHKPYGLLNPLPVPTQPWSSVSLDFITQLPVSNKFTAILVVVDRLTKMSHFIPTVNEIDAPQTAKLYLENIFKIHGLPRDIVSDRGSVFTSRFWTRLMELLNIKLNMSTAYHPQSDGQTERVNQVLEQYLRFYCDYQQDNWASLLPLAEFAYNNSSHSATKMSPFMANFGYHPVFSLSMPLSTTQVPAAESLVTNLKKAHNLLKENIKSATQSYEKYFNKKVMQQPDFSIGSKVWLVRKNINTTRPSSKLDYTKLGPFKILKKVGNRAYKLELPTTIKIHPVFHVSLLEPVVEEKIPGRTQTPPPPVIIDDSEEYEVENILDSRICRRKLQYLVDWKGHDPSARSWEPAENLANTTELVRGFHEQYPDKPSQANLTRTSLAGARP